MDWHRCAGMPAAAAAALYLELILERSTRSPCYMHADGNPYRGLDHGCDIFRDVPPVTSHGEARAGYADRHEKSEQKMSDLAPNGSRGAVNGRYMVR